VDDPVVFRGDEPAALVAGVLAAVEYARDHPAEDFRVGPFPVSDMLHSGLMLSGQHVVGVAQQLDSVPGLLRES
jgi:hypothetical protein